VHQGAFDVRQVGILVDSGRRGFDKIKNEYVGSEGLESWVPIDIDIYIDPYE
jgi:hypothetical protein